MPPRRPRPRPTLHLALHVAKLLEDALRARFTPEGLHQGQARFLDALARSGPSTVSDLARALHVAQPTATVLVQRMERAGLVQRRTAEDARSSRIALTPRGRRAAAVVEAAWAEAELLLRGALTEGEGAELHRLLGKVRDHLGGASPQLDLLDAASGARAAKEDAT